MKKKNEVFVETQRFTQGWIAAIVIAVMILVTYAWYTQVFLDWRYGSKQDSNSVMWMLWLIFGIAFPLLFALSTLITKVTEQAVVVRFIPFFKQTIPFNTITAAVSETYSPLIEYGGWGIRWSPGNGWCYNIKGNQGVRLFLASGKSILIGSQKAEELERSIQNYLLKRDGV